MGECPSGEQQCCGAIGGTQLEVPLIGLHRHLIAHTRLETEGDEAEVVGAGQMLIEAGVDRQQGVTYPASGLQGNLWRFGTFGLSFGVGTIVEFQLDGGGFGTFWDDTDTSVSARLVGKSDRERDLERMMDGVRRFSAIHLTDVMRSVTEDPFPASYSDKVRQVGLLNKKNKWLLQKEI